MLFRDGRLHGSIIVTYRCNARCNMCNVWEHPTKPAEEIGLEVIEKLPPMRFCNVTGGEPFVRRDLPDIVEILNRKAGRIVISTNGFFTDRIVSLCQRFPRLGIRISVEGLRDTNDRIRGIPEGFDRAMRTLGRLREMGLKDIGFAATVQDSNAQDLAGLHAMASEFGYEFATATMHNSHYFHKWDNAIRNKEGVIAALERLIDQFLRSHKAKDWFRAYFNYGLINYLQGRERLLPCEMGRDGFFLDPWGDVLACNGMDAKCSMGNLKEKSWDEIWRSARAEEVRAAVRICEKNCWMIGSAAPAMRHHPLKPLWWVLKKKWGLPFDRVPEVSLP